MSPSIIPTFYCDHCGHAFTHIDTLTGINRCPRCGNPNFELLVNENNEKGAVVVQPSVSALAGMQAQD
jgi:predicted  nucleic acid-binding Zn-ribbon protein